MLDNTILIDQESQADFIVRKLEEDVIVTEFMKDALKLYKQKLQEVDSE